MISRLVWNDCQPEIMQIVQTLAFSSRNASYNFGKRWWTSIYHSPFVPKAGHLLFPDRFFLDDEDLPVRFLLSTIWFYRHLILESSGFAFQNLPILILSNHRHLRACLKIRSLITISEWYSNKKRIRIHLVLIL